MFPKLRGGILVAAVIGPTYDNLLVPALQPSALFPPLVGPGSANSNYLTIASHFSGYVLYYVVDPSIALVDDEFLLDAIVFGCLIVGVVGANFTVPIAGGILGVAGTLFPVISAWDGGAWQQWVHLAGWGESSFSWDNGALAFVLSLVEFAVVFALVIGIGIRDALLAVLLVLLPIFTLLWPLRPLSVLARRGWFLFAELAFLPCVLIIPLELAVGSPDPVTLVSYLAIAAASPLLISVAGTQLVAFGFAGVSGTVHGSSQRGLQSAPSAASSPVRPILGAARTDEPGRAAFVGTTRALGSTGAPMVAPLAVGELLGHAGGRVFRHIAQPPGSTGPDPSAPMHR
jgi:hypothetical protein